MSDISQDEIISIQNNVISYIHDARLYFEQGDYQRAISFLGLAQNEIEYLVNHGVAQQKSATALRIEIGR